MSLGAFINISNRIIKNISYNQLLIMLLKGITQSSSVQKHKTTFYTLEILIVLFQKLWNISLIENTGYAAWSTITCNDCIDINVIMTPLKKGFAFHRLTVSYWSWTISTSVVVVLLFVVVVIELFTLLVFIRVNYSNRMKSEVIPYVVCVADKWPER